MNINWTIAKLELKEMLNELLQTEDVKRWTEAHLSQFLTCAQMLLPAGSRRFCFWRRYLILDGLELLAQRHLALRIELKRGHAEIVDEVPEDAGNEDNEYFTRCIDKHEFFSILKSAILEKRFYVPQIPTSQVDYMEMKRRGGDMSFIPSENKTAFAKLIFDLVGLEEWTSTK